MRNLTSPQDNDEGIRIISDAQHVEQKADSPNDAPKRDNILKKTLKGALGVLGLTAAVGLAEAQVNPRGAVATTLSDAKMAVRSILDKPRLQELQQKREALMKKIEHTRFVDQALGAQVDAFNLELAAFFTADSRIALPVSVQPIPYRAGSSLDPSRQEQAIAQRDTQKPETDTVVTTTSNGPIAPAGGN